MRDYEKTQQARQMQKDDSDARRTALTALDTTGSTATSEEAALETLVDEHLASRGYHPSAVKGSEFYDDFKTLAEKVASASPVREGRPDQITVDELARIRALCVEAGMTEPSTTLDYIRSVFYRLKLVINR